MKCNFKKMWTPLWLHLAEYRCCIYSTAGAIMDFAINNWLHPYPAKKALFFVRSCLLRLLGFEVEQLIIWTKKMNMYKDIFLGDEWLFFNWVQVYNVFPAKFGFFLRYLSSNFFSSAFLSFLWWSLWQNFWRTLLFSIFLFEGKNFKKNQSCQIFHVSKSCWNEKVDPFILYIP